MGKKSVKGKEKKLERKKIMEDLKKSVEAVREANKIEDPLKPLIAFQKYNRNGLDVSISCKKVCDMNEEEIEQTFKLLETNMKTLYENSSWGWSEKKKREEMTEENARYLLVKDGDNNLLAMSHFRFDVDEGVEVVYCYEVQIDKDFRGKGLGKFLMQILELMAIKSKMEKVILTVFKANTNAVNFFEKMKYTIDETSPRFDDPMNPDAYDYEIYSKFFGRRKNEP